MSILFDHVNTRIRQINYGENSVYDFTHLLFIFDSFFFHAVQFSVPVYLQAMNCIRVHRNGLMKI